MKPVIWIIDEEWADYDVETAALKKAFPECEIHCSKYDYANDLAKFGSEVDGILSQVYTTIGAKEIEKLDKCKVISVFGGGYDRVDVRSAREKGIQVAFVPGYCVEDVSDYVIAAIFHCNKHITSFSPQMADKLWGSPALPEPGRRIKNSKLLIIGLGRIGSAVAKKAKALGMGVFAYDPYVSESNMVSIGVSKVESLIDGLAKADYISINAKLTPETEKLLGEEEIASMKATSYIINTARGRIIDEKAMIKAVNSNKIAGAVLDVVGIEPPTFDEDVFNAEKILVTPHISYLSAQAYDELKHRTADNLIKVLNNEPISDIAE